jgi:pimeloyl-ACP methyl ester carboxylesterase
VLPPAQIRSTFPVLRNPANRHKAVGFTHEQWHYAFTNTFGADESRRLYERYAIPASRSILWSSVLANLRPGHHDAWVNYRNDDRAPLLFISGGEDHLMPPSVQPSNAKHYTSSTLTEIREYTGKAHLLPAREGWEEIADYAPVLAVSHATGARRDL